jgi:transporter family protein
MALLTNWVVLGLLSAIFAALVAILAKLGLQSVDATLATTVRAAIMALLLIAVSLTTGRFALLSGFSGDAWVLIVLSGLAGAASWLCYFLAIQVGNASQVSALDRLSIVFVVILAGVFLGEDLGPLKLLGAGLIVAGALLIAR